MCFLMVLEATSPREDPAGLVSGDNTLAGIQMDERESSLRFLLRRVSNLSDKDLTFISLFNLDQFLIDSTSKYSHINS